MGSCPSSHIPSALFPRTRQISTGDECRILHPTDTYRTMCFLCQRVANERSIAIAARTFAQRETSEDDTFCAPLSSVNMLFDILLVHGLSMSRRTLRRWSRLLFSQSHSSRLCTRLTCFESLGKLSGRHSCEKVSTRFEWVASTLRSVCSHFLR